MAARTKKYNKGQLNCDDYLIAGEALDFRWTHEDIAELKHMYSEGYSLSQMAKHFGRRVSEILVMIDQLICENKMSTHNRKLVLM